MDNSATGSAGKGKEFHPHKLFAPPLRPDVISREAILNRIFGEESLRVVVMQAPPGYGKTTTLLQVKTACEEQGFLTAWLTFDEADNDMRRFLIHFEALLASARSDAAVAADEIDYQSPGYRSDWVIDRLLGLGQPVMLFLDNFQVLENSAILDFFRELLERLPESARIFIGSRSMPRIGLARLLVNAQIIVVRPEELRFSSAEAELFLAGTKTIEITNVEVDRIYGLSEGWPAALQLYRLSLVNPAVRPLLGGFSSSRPRELAEYLADNVLALQAPDIQDFLLRTSLLTRLTAPLCDVIIGRSDSREILLSLERSGLFVRSLDLDARWFEYHALFASFLSEQLHIHSEAVALEVHRRAAQWHLQDANYEEAVRHAIACRDFPLAADTLDVWSSQLVAGGFLITMERWCDRIPFEEIASRPSLLIKNAWALVFLRRREKLKPVLALLAQRRPPFDVGRTTDPTIVMSMAAIARDNAAAAFHIVDRISIGEQKAEAFAAFELAAAGNLMGFQQLAYGNFESARRCLAIARVQGEHGNAAFSRGYTIGIAGVNLMAQGQLREALDSFKVVMAEQRMHVDRSAAAVALACCYIWGLYEANELDAAEALFGRYNGIIAEATLLDFLAVAQVSMARIHDVRGRHSKALAVLDESEVVGHANDWWRFLRTLSWERVRGALLSGDLQRAKAIAAASVTPEGTAPEEWLMFSEDLEGESLGRIRLAIYEDHFDLAKKRLHSEFARQRSRVFRQIKLCLLDAQLQYRQGSRNVAQRSLCKALQLAAPGRYIRCFLDEGEQVLDMLREEYQSLVDSGGREVPQGTDRAFVEQLLQASGTDLSRRPVLPGSRLLKPLTDREKKILLFVANGVSNKEMASRLFVSENTVKFHLKHIYSKLDASSRLQAIARARDLGLVK